MRARELLSHLRQIEEKQAIVDTHGGTLEQTGPGFFLWQPPSSEAWEAYVKDQQPARDAALAEFMRRHNSAPTIRPADPRSEPEETLRERRRRLRLANRDPRITWA